jgi:hypothetical protein
MKTKLPESINTVGEATAFLTELFNNGEAFHPEDAAQDILWALPEDQRPTWYECIRLNTLMNECFHVDPDFDPCAVFCDLLQTEMN